MKTYKELIEATRLSPVARALAGGSISVKRYRDGTPASLTKKEKKVLFSLVKLPDEQNDGSFIITLPSAKNSNERVVLFKETLADDDDFFHYVLVFFVVGGNGDFAINKKRKGDASVGQQGVADFVPDSEGPENSRELKDFLRKHLR